MVKKFLLSVVLCGSFCFSRASQSEEDLQSLLEQVDFVLFILERNTVRMERYGLHELNDDVNYLSRDVSKKHCLFKLSLAGAGSSAQSLAWDDTLPDCLTITSGKRKEPVVYHLLMSKIFPAHIQFDALPIVPFDCVVNPVPVESCSEKGSECLRKTLVDVIVPFGEGHLSSQLILDGVVRGASGFFVQHDVFEQELALSGRVKREKAIEDGLLVEVLPEQELQEADCQVIQKALEEKGVATVETFLNRFKNNIVAAFLYLKLSISGSWSKFLALFSR